MEHLKQKIVKFLFWLIYKIVGKRPCVINARLFTNAPHQKQLKECPFCNIDTQQLYNTVEKTYYWNVIYNKYPYPETELHLLLTPKRHISKWHQLSYNELQELQTLISQALSSGFILLGRHYPYAGSSIEHLHIHLLKLKYRK